MRDFKKVSVVGAGAWGTSLAIILSKNVREVGVWAREDEVIKSVEQERLNKIFSSIMIKNSGNCHSSSH